jgi:hypothetical protein
MKIKLENDGKLKLSEAQSYIRHILIHLIPDRIGMKLPDTVTVNLAQGSYEININDEINFVRTNGVADRLQNLYDCSDSTLNSMFNLGFEGDKSTNMSFNAKFGSCEKTLNSNGLIESPEQSFSRDICHHRDEFIKSCLEKDQMGYTRAYRSALLSSVSLVECFLQRYIFLVRDGIIKISDAESFEEYTKKSLRISDRIDLWMKIFTSRDPSELHASKEYMAFMEIKNKRNEIVHPDAPMIVYQVKGMIRIMNRVMSGIGGFIILLRSYEGRPEYIGFFRRIYNQRKIEIIK